MTTRRHFLRLNISSFPLRLLDFLFIFTFYQFINDDDANVADGRAAVVHNFAVVVPFLRSSKLL